MTLREFFDAQYVPARLPGLSAVRHSPRYVEMLDHLALALGREPLVSDLSSPGLASLQKAVKAPKCRERVVRHFVSLWRFAFESGYVSEFDQAGIVVKRRAKTVFDEEPPEGSLVWFYRTTLRPEFIENRSASYALSHDQAINKFTQFCRQYVAIEEVSQDTIDAFCQAIEDTGKSPTRHRGCILRILKRAKPKTFDQETVDCKTDDSGPSEPPWLQIRPAELPSRGTLRHLFETQYRPERLLDATAIYVNEIRATLVRLNRHFGRELLLDELTNELAADHFAWLRDQGLKPASINSGHRATIFAIWRFAFERKLIDRGPSVRKLRETREEPDSWTIEEARRIVSAATLVPFKDSIGGIEPGSWWKAILLVCWWTALRRKSLLAIKRDHVNLDTGWLTLKGDSIKNKRGKQFRIGADAVCAIRDIWLPDRELLFPWPDRIEKLHHDFRRILAAAGVRNGHRTGLNQFHKLRRTVATQVAVNSGIEAASSLLGHSSQQVTLRYVDPSKLPGNDATKHLPQLSPEETLTDNQIERTDHGHQIENRSSDENETKSHVE